MPVPLRVLIVDDSRIFRSELEDILRASPDTQIVGSVWTGEKALEVAEQSPPDFVTLDIEMPGMGGLATLRALKDLASRQQRPLGVLLISSHTRRGAAVTIEGLQSGAFDFLTKPDSPDPQVNAKILKQQVLDKVALFRVSRDIGTRTVAAVPPSRSVSARQPTQYRALLIAASTGGPDALARWLPLVAAISPVPIFLVQHLPPNFTSYFAESLERRCGCPVIEACDGVVPVSGTVYVAPSGRHLSLHKLDGQVHMSLTDAPPENGCRPAADVLFRSAATAFDGRVLAVVLTGMGSDGAKGAAVLKRSGARVLVQSEATSVVWGMPGSTVAAGAADEIVPLDQMGATVRSHLGLGA